MSFADRDKYLILHEGDKLGSPLKSKTLRLVWNNRSMDNEFLFIEQFNIVNSLRPGDLLNIIGGVNSA